MDYSWGIGVICTAALTLYLHPEDRELLGGEPDGEGSHWVYQESPSPVVLDRRLRAINSPAESLGSHE
jgi:hypothetical protein